MTGNLDSMLRIANRSVFIAALLLSACSGCRLWRVDALPVRDPLSATMLDAMRHKLDGDNWHTNPNWSLLNVSFHEREVDELKSTPRWIYGNHDLDHAIDQLDSATQTAPDDTDPEKQDNASIDMGDSTVGNSEQWDGFWPLNVEQVLDSIDVNDTFPLGRSATGRLGTQYLSRLAREDSLSGWNAAILLAQRDPQAAREFLPILERIVISYRNHKPPPGDSPSKAGNTIKEATGRQGPDEKASRAEDESIESLIERVARRLQNDIKTSDEMTDVTSKQSQQQDEIQEEKLLSKLLDRVKESSVLKKDEPRADPRQSISNEMRAAAAEAWCLALSSSGIDPYDQLAPAGRVLERSDLPNRLRSELYRAIARVIAPASIPRLSNAMRISERGQRVPLEVRLASVESCLIYAMLNRRMTDSTERGDGQIVSYDESLWPETILNCGSDSDATVRRTFGRWVAVVQYRGANSDAISILASQLQDQQRRVRHDALTSLGWLGTPNAREKLRQYAERPEAVIRAAAVKGLARWGVPELAPKISDESAMVRLAVTKSLADHPSARCYFLMQQLLADGDLQVQAAAVESIRNWPDDPALTLLLTSLRDSSGPTRRLAFQQLRKRRAVDDAFSKFDSPKHSERVRAVDELGAMLDIPLQFSDRFAIADVTAMHSRNKVFVQDVESLLEVVTDADVSIASPQRAEAMHRLRQLQMEDVPVVEQYLQNHPGRDTGYVMRELLPQLSPAHAALNELDRNDLQGKRQAAEQLRRLSAAGTLSPYVIRKLLPHLNGRQDLLVWRSSMAAVMADATEIHAEVALRALNDERADVRLLGIEFIQRHPQPKYARWLQQFRMFHDADKRVRLAAITAAGRCGNPGVVSDRTASIKSSGTQTVGQNRIPGLRTLLTHADAETRLAASIALSHLGDQQGMHELQRLIWSPEPKTRLAAVRAIGETDSTWFLEPLIRRGWTERHLDVRRAILKSLEQLTLPGKRPSHLLDENGYDAKIKTWLEWWEQRHGPRVAG